MVQWTKIRKKTLNWDEGGKMGQRRWPLPSLLQPRVLSEGTEHTVRNVRVT